MQEKGRISATTQGLERSHSEKRKEKKIFRKPDATKYSLHASFFQNLVFSFLTSFFGDFPCFLKNVQKSKTEP